MPNHTVDRVIEASLECAQACDTFATQALSELDSAQLARSIRLSMDCAEICLETVRLIRRGSELQIAMCHLCIEACDLCGEECRRHAYTVEACRICSEACEECAALCKNMARAMAEA